MDGGIKRPGEWLEIDGSRVLEKRIKKEIIDVTEENVVSTEETSQEHEVGCMLRQRAENGAVNTSTEVLDLSENVGNDRFPAVKEETVRDDSLVMESTTTENSLEESEKKVAEEKYSGMACPVRTCF